MAKITLDNFVLKEVMRINAFTPSTGALKFSLFETSDVTFTNGVTTSYATGANNVKLAGFDSDKSTTISGNSGLISVGLISSQIGNEIDFLNETKEIVIKEIVTSTGGVYKTKYIGAGEVGNEIKYIYCKNNKNETGAKYQQGATASATNFAYDPSTKKITLPIGVVAPNELLIYYTPVVKDVTRIINKVDGASETVDLVIDTLLRDVCDAVDFKAQIRMRAKVDGNFALTTGTEASKHPFSFESVLGCGDAKLWELDIYDDLNVTE